MLRELAVEDVAVQAVHEVRTELREEDRERVLAKHARSTFLEKDLVYLVSLVDLNEFLSVEVLGHDVGRDGRPVLEGAEVAARAQHHGLSDARVAEKHVAQPDCLDVVAALVGTMTEDGAMYAVDCLHENLDFCQLDVVEGSNVGKSELGLILELFLEDFGSDYGTLMDRDAVTAHENSQNGPNKMVSMN